MLQIIVFNLEEKRKIDLQKMGQNIKHYEKIYDKFPS
jgi:hypothetical protein